MKTKSEMFRSTPDADLQDLVDMYNEVHEGIGDEIAHSSLIEMPRGEKISVFVMGQERTFLNEDLLRNFLAEATINRMHDLDEMTEEEGLEGF